ncbi:MAG: hypothetical protein WKF51_10630, partial [Geodermatophilaceae bacterium]
PWRFRRSDSSLEIHADWNRRLRVRDPRGRQLLISCGCAVFNARVALAAAGYDARVERFPEPAQPNLLARLTAQSHSDAVPIGALDSVIELRHTNRRTFADEPMPDDVLDALVAAAHDEGAEAFPVLRPDHRLATIRLSRQADDLESVDLAYWAELRAWTSGDPGRHDGVLPIGVPNGSAVASRDPLIRDFDDHGVGRHHPEGLSSSRQSLLLLGTRQDSQAAWLRAGEALEHVLLEITRRGYVASPVTQVIEVAATNALLCQELELTMHPQLLLRVGRAPATPASRRRRLVDMVEESR